jgi:hypothetical protein
VSLRPIPDINNEASMLARGRASALRSARNEACQELRDISTAAQHTDAHELASLVPELQAVAKRFSEITQLSEKK